MPKLPYTTNWRLKNARWSIDRKWIITRESRRNGGRQREAAEVTSSSGPPAIYLTQRHSSACAVCRAVVMRSGNNRNWRLTSGWYKERLCTLVRSGISIDMTNWRKLAPERPHRLTHTELPRIVAARLVSEVRLTLASSSAMTSKCGATIRVFVWRLRGRGFDSRSFNLHATTLDKFTSIRCLCIRNSSNRERRRRKYYTVVKRATSGFERGLICGPLDSSFRSLITRELWPLTFFCVDLPDAWRILPFTLRINMSISEITNKRLDLLCCTRCYRGHSKNLPGYTTMT